MNKFKFTKEEVAKLLKMQDTLNKMVHPEWIVQGFNWNLAIVDECMEIHGHLGWKWWKGLYQVGVTEANKKQIQLEVIDILHFALSIELVDSYDRTSLSAVAGATYSLNTGTATGDTLATWLKYCLVQAADENFDLSDWVQLAELVGLTKQEIMETYVQKYVLNKFRQDHGYKDGSYVKQWEVMVWAHTSLEGEIINKGTVLYEDNEVLEKLVRKLSIKTGKDTTDETVLYNALKLAYDNRLNQ